MCHPDGLLYDLDEYQPQHVTTVEAVTETASNATKLPPQEGFVALCPNLANIDTTTKELNNESRAV